MSYDAWGRTRNADGTDDNTCSLPAASPTTRGYTSQEEMPAVCLINYNARIYDPTLGRFLSPDSVTQNVYDMQLLNRYTYVGNNPLSFTDPTGHLFGIDDFFIAFVLVAILAPELHQIPILGSLATILAGFGCGPLGPICAGIIAAEVTGIQGGTMAQAFKAAVFTIIEAKGFQLAGNIVGPGSGVAHTAETFLAHGMVGGIVSAAEGGRFTGGFLAAGVSSLADVVNINAGSNDASIAANTALHSVLGGVGSELGGGKFANGAVTGAFGYMYNALEHQDSVNIGGHWVPKSLLMQIQQDIASRSVQVPGRNTPDEWLGYILDDLTYVLYPGTASTGGQHDAPPGAIIQFHSHPPDFTIGLDDPENSAQDHASKCDCTDPHFYGDIERWASFHFWGSVTGAVVFGPNGAESYDLRTITMTSPQAGTPVLSSSEVSWPLHK